MNLCKILTLASLLVLHFNTSYAQEQELTSIAVLGADGILEPIFVKSDTSWSPASDADYERMKYKSLTWYAPQSSGDTLVIDTGYSTPVIFEESPMRIGKGFVVRANAYLRLEYGLAFDAPIYLEWKSTLSSSERDNNLSLIHERKKKEEKRILETSEHHLHYDSVTVVTRTHGGIPIDSVLRDSVELKINQIFSMTEVADYDKILYISTSGRYPYNCGSTINISGWIFQYEGGMSNRLKFGVGDCDGKGLGPFIKPMGAFLEEGKLYLVAEIQYYEGHGYGLYELTKEEVRKISEFR